MTKLPIISGKKVVKALSRVGFFVHHQKGSHIVLRRNETGKVTNRSNKALKSSCSRMQFLGL
ncbi:MAG: type II toxin-antitoxin system HicA family toxin [Candidatus Heimdallarchaeota archaeon]